MQFERQRLIDDGRPDLAAQVQWLARESDAYGFDILSFMGGRETDADSRIAIEVKASTLPSAAHLHFFLSAHEWETAKLLGDRYRVHAWLNIDPGPPPKAQEQGPIIVASSTIVSHLPETPDCGERCRWYTAEVFLALG